MKFRNILLGTLLSFTYLESVPFAKADSYSAPGTVYEQGKGVVGSVGSNGTVYAQGQGVVGSVGSNGTVYGQGQGVVGSVGSDGTIYQQGRGVVGNVNSNGTISEQGKGVVGSVSSDGTVYAQGRGVIGHVPPGNPAVAFGMLTGQNSNNNGTPSAEQQEAEIRQMQQAQPVPQGQPSCFAGCITPPPSFKHKINIRTLNGALVGWADGDGIKLAANALPVLHLNPPIGDKYSGMDMALMFPDYGEAYKITRLLSDMEEDRIKKNQPEMAKKIENKMYIPMGYVDQFGNITDLQGKKIAYEEIGDIVYDVNAAKKTGIYQNNHKFYYPNVLGVFEPNGDVRDVHNRLVGHLDESQRDDADSGQPEALKLIQKYEKQHPWHPASRHPVKK